MRTRREPFFGMPEDARILENVVIDETGAYNAALLKHGMPDAEVWERYMLGSSGDGTTEGQPTAPVVKTVHGPFSPHPDAVEKGIELPLGYHQHPDENRTQRRAAVATWAPPKVEGAPTRRELLEQRQRQRRGKLDPELRRMQRKAMSK